MIIEPFTVVSRGKNYRFVQAAALDSDKVRRTVRQQQSAALDYTQAGALCRDRGLPDHRELQNFTFAVFESGLKGVWMLGSIIYVSGPWTDLATWDVANQGATVVIQAVPMPGLLSLAIPVEADFAADSFAAFLTDPNLLATVQGSSVAIDMLYYGIFLNRNNPVDNRVKAQHNAAKAHPALSVTETPHPTIQGMTLVEVRAL